jgi:hypothetical protein
MDNPLYDAWHEYYKDAKLTDYGRWVFPEESPREMGERWMGMFARQKQLQHQYAWAIPDQAAIELLVRHSPIVEIGAGRGYWASLVQAAGGDVVCYDENPPDSSTENIWCPPDGIKTVFQTVAKIDTLVFTKIREGGPEKVLEHQDRTLFLCWPPMSTMAHEAVTNYTGDTVIYVGEGDGGCTADDAFFEHMREHFERTEDHDIPFWEGMNDYLSVFTKSTR